MPVRLPPGPKGNFLTGNIREFRHDRLGLFLRCARDYGDIADKSGRLIVQGPGFDRGGDGSRLVRHPRKRDTWGLDTQALDTPGTYSFEFIIDGPQGEGQGTLNGVTVLDQPGPPLPLSWAVGSLPFGALLAFLVIAWRRCWRTVFPRDRGRRRRSCSIFF